MCHHSQPWSDGETPCRRRAIEQEQSLPFASAGARPAWPRRYFAGFDNAARSDREPSSTLSSPRRPSAHSAAATAAMLAGIGQGGPNETEDRPRTQVPSKPPLAMAMQASRAAAVSNGG